MNSTNVERNWTWNKLIFYREQTNLIYIKCLFAPKCMLLIHSFIVGLILIFVFAHTSKSLVHRFFETLEKYSWQHCILSKQLIITILLCTYTRQFINSINKCLIFLTFHIICLKKRWIFFVYDTVLPTSTITFRCACHETEYIFFIKQNIKKKSPPSTPKLSHNQTNNIGCTQPPKVVL